MKSTIFLATVILALFSGTNTSAALFEMDSDFGPDTITFDSETGFEWLDLTLTLGLSVLEVEAQLPVGGEYFGWRYATSAEIETLFYTSADLPANEYATLEDAPKYLEMQRLFGITIDGVVPGCYLCMRMTAGFNATYTQPDWRQVSQIMVEWYSTGTVRDMFSAVAGGNGIVSSGNQITGHWLMRDPGAVGVEESTWGTLKALYR